MSTDIILQVRNLTKEDSSHGLKLLLLNNISFEIPESSFTGILGPQRTSKSLLLQLIAGLSEPTSGTINGYNHKIVYIASQPSSFPWLNVKANIQMALDHNKVEHKKQLSELIELVGLSGYEDHYPANKSYGFRFRISLARAVAYGAKLILLDEPFNNMDQITKREMYKLTRKVYQLTGISFLVATSNITEVVFLSDRILFLNPQSCGIINETFTTISDSRGEDLFNKSAFKEKVKEIEELVKTGESLDFNSYLI